MVAHHRFSSECPPTPSSLLPSFPLSLFPSLPPPHPTYNSVGLTVCIARAIDQTEHSVGFPAIIPEPHRNSVLT